MLSLLILPLLLVIGIEALCKQSFYSGALLSCRFKAYCRIFADGELFVLTFFSPEDSSDFLACRQDEKIELVAIAKFLHSS